MWELLIKYITVYLASAIKYVLGPILGVSYGLSAIEIIVLNVAGMMTSVLVITYFGKWIRHQSQALLRKKKRNIFSKKTRKYVLIWQKFGTPGIAFFTPILFMPIGGALLANAFGCKKRDIFLYMFLSFLFWSIFLTLMLTYAAEWVPFLDVS